MRDSFTESLVMFESRQVCSLRVKSQWSLKWKASLISASSSSKEAILPPLAPKVLYRHAADLTLKLMINLELAYTATDLWQDCSADFMIKSLRN